MPKIDFIKASSDHIDQLVEFHMSFSEEFHGKQKEEFVAELKNNLRQFYSEDLNKSYLSWMATVDGTPAAVGGPGSAVR